MPQAGFDPPFVCFKRNDLLNEKVEAPTNQATAAGFYWLLSTVQKNSKKVKIICDYAIWLFT